MRVKRVFLIAAIIAFTAISCGGNNVSPEPEPDPGNKESASLLFDVSLDGALPFTWSSSDQIKVSDPTTGANYGNASLQSGEGSAKASFKLVKTLSAGTSLCLVYPSSKTVGSNSSLPQNQTLKGFGDPDISQYLFAVSESFASAASNSVTLRNPFAAIRVRLDSDAFKGYKLSTVTVRCTEAALSGTFTISKSTLSFKAVDSKGIVSVTVTGENVISGNDSYVTALCFPSDCSGKDATIEFVFESSAGAQVEKSYNLSLGKLDAGTITEIRTSDLKGTEYVLTDVPYYWWRNGQYVNAPSRTISGMNNLEKLSEDTSRDRWGGFDGVSPTRITSANTAGYWRTGYYNDKKVFVDPDGNVAFLSGLNFVTPDVNIDNYNYRVASYYNTKFASIDSWAQWCAPKIAGLGFNFYSNSPRRIAYYDNMPSPGLNITSSVQQSLRQGDGTHQMSQCENLFLLRTFYWDYRSISGKSFSPSDQSEFTLMFDPDYLSRIKTIAEYGAALFKGDRGFIGYYTDNELPFMGTTTTYPAELTLKSFLNLTTDTSADKYYRCNAAARQWALDWMQSTYGTQEYASSMEKPFIAAIADYYFKTASEAVRAADPDHLLLGCRLHSDPKETKEIMEACAKYCDVVSFNFYAYWDITSFGAFSSYPSWTGDKPVLVSEFYTKDSTLKSPDGISYKNGEGAGWIVDSQKDRGIFYQNNIIHFIEDSQIAGWQWFKWTDDYDTSSDGWVNKGLVAPDYSGLYDNCTKLMKEVNINEYQLLKYYHCCPEKFHHKESCMTEPSSGTMAASSGLL